MGIGWLRALVALLVALFVASAAPAAFAGSPIGGGGGCAKIQYNQFDGGVGVSTVCHSLPGSKFFAGSDGAVDMSCSYHNPVKNPDGTVTLEGPFTGTWFYKDETQNTVVVPINAHWPAGVSLDEWLSTFPKFGAGTGERLFTKWCEGPESQYAQLYPPPIVVPPTDPFWENLPGQVAALAATIQLGTPKLAFTPGGPEVWGGFLTNAPYGVSLANDGIWHSIQTETVDHKAAWRLTAVATPVSATVNVDRGHGTEKLACDIGANGPVTQWGLPRFDPPTSPVALPACAFTARWAQTTSVSVSMTITYREVGFIGDLAQPLPDQQQTSALQTWPVIRTEAANTQAG